MKTINEIIQEKTTELEKWASQHIDTDKKYRITAYAEMRKISVEVFSPNTNQWLNVHTENL